MRTVKANISAMMSFISVVMFCVRGYLKDVSSCFVIKTAEAFKSFPKRLSRNMDCLYQRPMLSEGRSGRYVKRVLDVEE
jgi:hypothetical protein